MEFTEIDLLEHSSLTRMPDYWVGCQYDLTSTCYWVRFSIQKPRLKTMYLASDNFIDWQECLYWAKKELTYSALQSFREYIEASGGDYES